jgi:hypothetical protein
MKMRMREPLDALQCVSVPLFADEGEDRGTAGDSLKLVRSPQIPLVYCSLTLSLS